MNEAFADAANGIGFHRSYMLYQNPDTNAPFSTTIPMLVFDAFLFSVLVRSCPTGGGGARLVHLCLPLCTGLVPRQCAAAEGGDEEALAFPVPQIVLAP